MGEADPWRNVSHKNNYQELKGQCNRGSRKLKSCSVFAVWFNFRLNRIFYEVFREIPEIFIFPWLFPRGFLDFWQQGQVCSRQM